MLPILIASQLHTWEPTSERVLVRVDLNVPIADGVILDDFRIKAIFPTLDRLQQLGAPFTLITHLGRPKGQEESLSTRHLCSALAKYNVQFAPDIATARAAQSGNLILENLRFFPGEKERDPAFAQELSTLGTFFVNDAFATLHRSDASLTLLPTYFSPERRTIGLLIEQELAFLSATFSDPKRPLYLIMGGGKGMDKLQHLKALLSTINGALIGPALSLPLSIAQGISMQEISATAQEVALCNDIRLEARKKEVTLAVPTDYQVATGSRKGPLSFISAEELNQQYHTTSIGPETIAAFNAHITQAGTILLNGCFGFNDRPETLEGIGALFRAMGQSSATSVISGGNSVAAVRQLGLTECVDHLSTGGGATLAVISDQPLPGLQALGITRSPLKNRTESQ